ncbi:hypothetical protein [Nocardia wallacei]|uniref:hypothetical protein n=1 Tax=Nocardia wallacei TaxID=480035 RepID=UPI0024587B41|nr:hypothetical protein [Nocardia wallacei]
MTRLREYGPDYALTLARASDLADHDELEQAARSLRDAVDVLRRTSIDQAAAAELVYQHLLAWADAVTADIHASGRARH